MKKRFLLMVCLLIVCLTLVIYVTLASRSGSTSSGISSNATSGGGTTAQSTGGKKTDLIIGTGGTAGTYYVVAAAMAQAVNNHSSILNIIAQPSKGSVENINLCSTGDIQMGMSNADGVYWATTGTGTYGAIGEQNISAVMSLYLSAGQMATLKSSGIETYGDLKGKKVCLGPPSTTIVEMSKSILRAYGIDPEKDITPFYLSFDEGLSKLTDGDIDATFFVAGVPTSAMINACSTGNVQLVKVDDAILEQVAEENPYLTPYIIPAGTYKGVDGDIKTLKIMTEYFVNNDTSDEVVYEFVKTALENSAEFQNAHTVCAEITPENAAATISRLHPGAEKYYREIGVLF